MEVFQALKMSPSDPTLLQRKEDILVWNRHQHFSQIDMRTEHGMRDIF